MLEHRRCLSDGRDDRIEPIVSYQPGILIGVNDQKRRKLQEAAKQQPRKNGRFAEKPNSKQPTAAPAHDVNLGEKTDSLVPNMALYESITPLASKVEIIPGDKRGNMRQLRGFFRDIASIIMLAAEKDEGIVRIPDIQGKPITAKSLLETVVEHPNGFSISGRESETGLITLTEGYCVSIHGTDMVIESDIYYPASTVFTAEAIAEVKDCLSVMKPALDSGCFWIGGFKWEEGERAGKYEINLTLVFNLSEKTKQKL